MTPSMPDTKKIHGDSMPFARALVAKFMRVYKLHMGVTTKQDFGTMIKSVKAQLKV